MSRLASIERDYAAMQAKAPDGSTEKAAAGLLPAPLCRRPPRPAFLTGIMGGGARGKLKARDTILTRRNKDGGWEKVVEKRSADGTPVVILQRTFVD